MFKLSNWYAATILMCAISCTLSLLAITMKIDQIRHDMSAIADAFATPRPPPASHYRPL